MIPLKVSVLKIESSYIIKHF